MTTTDSAGHQSPRIDLVAVGSGYFRTIGATMREGRDIEEADRAGAPVAVVVNATLAQRLYRGARAVGRTMKFRGKDVEIVGVVADILQRELESKPAAIAYTSLAQEGMSPYERILVRASGPPEPIEAAITRAMQSIDKTLIPPAHKTMNAALAEAVAPRQFTFVLLGIFAALAAALAVIGLYGVLAHLVANRTREIGIRVALGADAGRVTALVLGQGLVLALLGVGIGIAASTVTVRAARSLVYDMSIYDPWTFTAGAVLMLGVSLIASYVPARRASRVDPVIALRAE
jgi:ABC-type antimicrobial peptide transport system permease subunit